jgi:tellurite resistance protein
MPRRLPSPADPLVELTPEEAIVAVGLITMAADEAVEEIEADLLIDIIADFEIFEEYSDDDFDETLDKLSEAFDEPGIEAVCGSALAALSTNEEFAEIALIVAILIVAADGEVPESEQEYLNSLQVALGIPDDRAEEIVESLFSEEDDEEDEEDEEA